MDDDLLGFERIYPAANQDLALVFINPGLRWRSSSIRLDDNYQLSNAEPTDWSRRCAISMDGGFKYLTEHNQDHSAFKRLRDLLRQVGEQTTLLSDLTATLNRPVEFFTDVYYTNWYKFATGGVGNIEEDVKHRDSFVSELLREELAVIDPKLVILFGKQPWVHGLRPYSESVGDAPAEATISQAQNHLYRCSLPETSFHVLPYNHPSDRDRKRAVGVDERQLQDSLEHFESFYR